MPYVIRWPHKRVLTLVAIFFGLLIAAQPAFASRGSQQDPAGGSSDAHHHDGDGSGPGRGDGGGGNGRWQLRPPNPDTPCPALQGSQVFGQFGDDAVYSLLPGGSFDRDMIGWSLNGASVLAGGEPWNVSGSSDPHSLSIWPGGQVLSPTFCLSNQFPTVRFFAQSSDPSGNLTVYVQWVTADGQTGQAPATTLAGGDYSSWAPSPAVQLGSALADGQKVTARLVFAADSGGSWAIDDVYIDPYAK